MSPITASRFYSSVAWIALRDALAITLAATIIVTPSATANSQMLS
jgi:hypothetical protein